MATEKRLIDANKAQAVLMNMAEHLMEAGNPEMAGAVGYAAEVIGKQRTVDAVKVVHGQWFWSEKNECWFCSYCEMSALNNYRGNSTDSNYCPNCGAKMDGDGNAAD